MPLLAWIGFIFLIGFFSFRLVRSAKVGTEKYGPFYYPRKSDPVLFWLLASMDLLCLVFASGFLLLIVKHQFF